MNLTRWRARWAAQTPRKLLIKPDVPLFSRSAVAEMRAAEQPVDLEEAWKRLLLELGVSHHIGPQGRNYAPGLRYDALVVGGVKAEGADFACWFESKERAIAAYLESLKTYIGGNKVIAWRHPPEICEDENGRGYQVYSRLVAFQPADDWITHDGKGFPAALKGVPPERVMMRTRGCGEGLASEWGTRKFDGPGGKRTYPYTKSIYWDGSNYPPAITHYCILPEVAT